MANSAVLSRSVVDIESCRRYLYSAWCWWLLQLSEILPVKVRRWLQRFSFSLTIYVEGDYCCCRSHKGSMVEFTLGSNSPPLITKIKRQLGILARQHAPAKLVLPEQMVLKATASLPEATERNLHQVLGFEMDRITPLAEGDVYFDYSVVQRHHTDQHILVELTLILRQKLDAIVASLRGLGVYPKKLLLRRDDGQELEVNLLPVGNDLPARFLHRLLCGCVAVLLVLIVFAPLFYLKGKVKGLQSEIDVVKANAVASSEYLQQTQQLQQQLQAMLQTRRQALPLVEVVAELTDLLPVHTWISRLTLNQQQLTLQGESTNASVLIETLEGSALFRNAAFDSSITRNPRSNKERFVINTMLLSRNLSGE